LQQQHNGHVRAERAWIDSRPEAGGEGARDVHVLRDETEERHLHPRQARPSGMLLSLCQKELEDLTKLPNMQASG